MGPSRWCGANKKGAAGLYSQGVLSTKIPLSHVLPSRDPVTLTSCHPALEPCPSYSFTVQSLEDLVVLRAP